MQQINYFNNFGTMAQHNYCVYIVTNKHRSVVYTGVTNNLQRRVDEHENGLIPGFSKKNITVII
jgi:putative endonuclease